MRELNRTAKVAGSDRLSNPNDRRRSMSQLLRMTSDSGKDSSDEQGRDGCSHLKTETKKGRRGRSPKRHHQEDIDGKRSKNKHECFQSSVNDDRHMSGTSSTDANSSSEERHDRCRAKPSNGEDKLKVIRLANYRFKVVVDYRMYRLTDTSPIYDRTMSKNVAKIAKRMKA